MEPLVILVTGMGVVFLGIVVLILIVKLMSLCCGAFSKKEKGRPKGAVSVQNASYGGPAAAGTAGSSGKRSEGTAADALTPAKRRELIAVISASIAEAAGMEAEGLRIRSIRRL